MAGIKAAAEEMASSRTTITDIPHDCLEVIMDNLALVDHYRGRECLLKPYSMEATPFSKHWFLSLSVKNVLGEDESEVNSHCYHLLFSDPFLRKEQKIVVDLEFKLSRGHHFYNIWRSFATDKGLLLVQLDTSWAVESRNRHNNDKYLILNPINNSMFILPPIPDPLCRCRFPDCSCFSIPLKLMVSMEHADGLKPSYSAYILERKRLPKSLRHNCKDPSSNFRVLGYDSLTKVWQRTGVEWTGNSHNTQIFPMSRGIFYLSTGRWRGPIFPETLHHIVYKFQDGTLIGKVKAPFQLKREERDCQAHHNNFSDSEPQPGCGCISTTIFEDDGKIFFFQQTSWVGGFGPNCISARIWELNDREMIWHSLVALPRHRFEFRPKRNMRSLISSNIFLYEGMLLVIQHDSFGNDEYFLVAGFDICKRTWCKVPENFLEHLPIEKLCGTDRVGCQDLEELLFQPNADIRV